MNDNSWTVYESRIQRESQLVQPTFPIIIFGDGTIAELIRIVDMNSVDDEGTPFIKLLLKPSEDLSVKYDLKNYLVGTGNTIVREFYKGYVDITNPDPYKGVWFILCDFNGCRTSLIDKQPLLDELRDLKIMLANRDAALAFYRSNERMLLENNKELARHIRDIVKLNRGAGADSGEVDNGTS